MKNKIISFLMISALLVTGSGFNTSFADEFKKIELNPIEIKESSNKPLKVTTVEFNKGKRKLDVTGNTFKMPYELNGILSVPKKKGKYPLAVIFHGSYDNSNPKKRFDKGFRYLTDHMAKQGFAAVALNIQPTYVWEYGDNDEQIKVRKMLPKFIASLKDINKTGKYTKKKSLKTLKGKIDFNNMIFIGHSRGGEMAFHYSNEYKAVKAMIGIANTEPILNKKYRDIPRLFIILPRTLVA